MPTKKYFSSYIIKFEEISKTFYFRKNINKNPIKIIKNGKKNLLYNYYMDNVVKSCSQKQNLSESN